MHNINASIAYSWQGTYEWYDTDRQTCNVRMAFADRVLIHNGGVETFHASKGRVHTEHDQHEKEYERIDIAECERGQDLRVHNKNQTDAFQKHENCNQNGKFEIFVELNKT